MGKGGVLFPANSLSSQESSNQEALKKDSSSNKSVLNKIDTAACVASSEDIQEEIFPLSGDPFFTCILVKSNVQSPFQLVVPRSFTYSLPTTNSTFILCYRNKTWEIGYHGAASLKRFDSKWKAFATDNNLKIGDACVFELIDSVNFKFNVQILDGCLPEPFRPKGANSDEPILIDDEDD